MCDFVPVLPKELSHTLKYSPLFRILLYITQKYCPVR